MWFWWITELGHSLRCGSRPLYWTAFISVYYLMRVEVTLLIWFIEIYTQEGQETADKTEIFKWKCVWMVKRERNPRVCMHITYACYKLKWKLQFCFGSLHTLCTIYKYIVCHLYSWNNSLLQLFYTLRVTCFLYME